MKRTIFSSLLAIGMAGGAWADQVIDFSGQGGKANGITFSGVIGTNLVATGNIQNVTYNNGPQYAVTGGTFSLAIPVLTITGTGVHRVYGLGSGGAFSITGAIPSLGVASTQLVYNGVLDVGGQLAAVNPAISSTKWNLTASGTDHKAPALLSALGVPNVLFLFSGITFNLAPTFNYLKGGAANINSFRATAVSTDLANTATPEPSAIIMLGTALAGASFVLRRKFKGGALS